MIGPLPRASDLTAFKRRRGLKVELLEERMGYSEAVWERPMKIQEVILPVASNTFGPASPLT